MQLCRPPVLRRWENQRMLSSSCIHSLLCKGHRLFKFNTDHQQRISDNSNLVTVTCNAGG